jgi:hypothetical protein
MRAIHRVSQRLSSSLHLAGRVRPAAAVLAVTLAALGSTGVGASDRQERQSANRLPQTIVFSVDVAEDFSLFSPTKVRPDDTQPERGAFFVTEGNIYPVGTIERGGTPEAPGPFDPNASGALGRWFCRGTHLVSGALFPSTARAVHTGQLYLLPNEAASLTTEGLEGNAAIVRAATGGTGPFKGYIGEQRQELLGFNNSGGVNLRVTFVLKKATD